MSPCVWGREAFPKGGLLSTGRGSLGSCPGREGKVQRPGAWGEGRDKLNTLVPRERSLSGGSAYRVFNALF